MSRVFAADQGSNQTVISTPQAAVYDSLPALTLAAWIYPTSLSDDDTSTVFIKNSDTSGTPLFTVGATSMFVQFGDDTANAVPDYSLPLNQWSHIATTWDSNGDGLPRVYVNGVETPYLSQTSGTGVFTDDSGYWFGNTGPDADPEGTNPVIGNLAEMAVFNVALNAGQIAALAASTTGATGIADANLVGYWHLCGTDSPEPDSSGNGNNGVLSSNPPTRGANSPGYSNCGGPMPSEPYSQPDCRDYGNFPNNSVDINGTETYTVPAVDSRAAGAPVDSRVSPPEACGTYPQNSRTPGTFGPGE